MSKDGDWRFTYSILTDRQLHARFRFIRPIAAVSNVCTGALVHYRELCLCGTALNYAATSECSQLWSSLYLSVPFGSLAFHNPSSFCGEAQEDPRERNYCCSRNLVQPLCLAMVSEDRFISPRREVLALNAGKSGPTFPHVSRNRKNAHGTVVRHFFHGSLGTDSSFSEPRDSVNGELKKRISCAIVMRFTKLSYYNFIFNRFSVDIFCR